MILSADKLAELRVDLATQDRLELDAKHKKTDPTGLKNEDLDVIAKHQFARLLQRYGLTESDEDDPFSNELPTNEEGDNYYQQNELMRRMEKIWRKAMDARLPETETNQLREKFMKQKALIDEYEALRTQLKQIEEKTTAGKLDRNIYDDKNAELKIKYKQLRRGYDDLENFVGLSNSERSSEFIEPKARDLWNEVLRYKLPQSEVDAFKNEIHFLEQRLKKQTHFQREIAVREGERREKTNRVNGEPTNDELNQLRDRVKELGFQVKKLYTDLRLRLDKLSRKHSEL